MISGNSQQLEHPSGQDATTTNQVMSLVTIDAVSKRFDGAVGSVQALQNISLAIGQGEFVSVVGPSGCGKSTLLRIVCGLETPSGGFIHWNQDDVRMGVAFQEHRLLPWLNIERNIALSNLMRGRIHEDSLVRSRQLCQLVGLSGFEKRAPMELSGGMKQRASVARALFTDPQLLLLDEPFGALDALTREQITNDTERIWRERGFAALLITHSIAEAVHLGDRIVVMSARPGRIAAILQNDLPRPRSTAVGTAEFAAVCEQVRARLEL